MKSILYLASKSKSRQILLNQAQIPFTVIEQEAQEDSFTWQLSLKDVLTKIALMKMKAAIVPAGQLENEICYVLAADTMGLDGQGNICSKPKDKDDAFRMIKSYRNGATTGTAFCLERKIWQKGKWHTQEQIVEYVDAQYVFDVPDNWIEKYFEMSSKSGIDFMQVSGAVAVEDFGAQFVKYINGSFTTIAGLPMFELRLCLDKLGFF